MAADVSEPGVRARRAAEAREKMVTAAIDLIAEGGSAGMTLARVGTAAGYSRGLADYHFGSKSALIQEVVRAIGSGVRRDVLVPAVRGTHGLPAVLRMMDAYFDGVRRAPTRFLALYVLIGESLATVPEIREILATQNVRFRDALQVQITEGIEDGTIRADVEVVASAAFVLSVIRGGALQWLLDPDVVDLDGLARRSSEIVRANLASA